MTMASTSKQSAAKQVRLPPSWSPSALDIICGRGSIAQQHEGNQRLKALVQSMLREYNASRCKFQKSKLVSKIVETVHEASPEGGFVKFIDDGWVRVTDRHAREKVGQLFRDSLHLKYKSSTKAKSKTRRERQVGDESNNSRSNSLTSMSDSSNFSEQGDMKNAIFPEQQFSSALPQHLQLPPSLISFPQENNNSLCVPMPVASLSQELTNSGRIEALTRSTTHSTSVAVGNNLPPLQALLPNFEPLPLQEGDQDTLFDLNFLSNDPASFLKAISDENIDEVCDFIFDECL